MGHDPYDPPLVIFNLSSFMTHRSYLNFGIGKKLLFLVYYQNIVIQYTHSILWSLAPDGKLVISDCKIID